MMSKSILVLPLLIAASILDVSSASTTKESVSSLGSFCNSIEGCGGEPSLTCIKNRCECAPGYNISANATESEQEEKCQFVGCELDRDCQAVDANRKCSNIGKCDQCTNGLVLDPTVNRCVTLLGAGCTRTRDCWYFGDNTSSVASTRDFDSMPMCRSGRCVCRTDYYPTEDWSRCEARNCSGKDECNPFGDDPYRYCSKALRRCLCGMGYYENAYYSICLPYIPLQYSLMMPFYLTLVMFIVCILIYVSRRLVRARTEANMAANNSTNSEEPPQVSHVLNLPPPSYETIVKETTTLPIEGEMSENTAVETQPPNYTTIVQQQQQA